MKKLIFLNFLFLFILFSCIKLKNPIFQEKPFVLKYMKKFGTLYHTNFSGIISDVFGFYTNDFDLKINSVIFIDEKTGKRKTTNKSIVIDSSKNNIYKEYKLFFFAFEERDTYDINKIILDTSRGNYFADINISSNDPPSELYNEIISQKVKIYTIHNTYSVDLFPDSLNHFSFNFYIKNSVFEILNISLFNEKEFPGDLKIENVFVNNVDFKKTERKYKYNNETVRFDIKLSYFPLGNYSFKIKCFFDGKNFEILAMPIIIPYMAASNFNDSHKKLTDAYFNGDFSVEFQPFIKTGE